MSVITLENIVFRRDGRAIIRGLRWSIEHGQHWALIGANGSGKTTLLRIMSGYAWPTEGSVSVLGARFGACDLRELRKVIGLVSTAIEGRLPGRDSALEVVASGFDATLGTYRKYSEAEWQRARQALAQLNCARCAEQRFDTLSQGEQKRVDIARALVNRPRLLILDEPCAGLDPAARTHFLEDVRWLAMSDQAPTIVLVTHHIEEIGPWMTHALVLKDGIAVSRGLIAESITSQVLSEAFSAPCEVYREKNEYRLRMY